jgi:hypothetical protein
MVFSMAEITTNFGLETKGVGTQTSITAKAVTNSVKPVNIGFWLFFIMMMLSGDVFKRNGYWEWCFEKAKIPIKNRMPLLYIILPKTKN